MEARFVARIEEEAETGGANAAITGRREGLWWTRPESWWKRSVSTSCLWHWTVILQNGLPLGRLKKLYKGDSILHLTTAREFTMILKQVN